ncbi:hypothetical protein [uncultured Arcobacter sp.]|uniref:hypothetical protein n=1 Tax=uncultured Arcobacter sp. TaxID=165434 RepID=UPI00261CC3C5|nr:hypothetical protein [uncultured Arcobacter sp.]
MKHRTALSHDQYLENLVTHLNLVGEKREEISWIIKDGIWMYDNSVQYHKLADLICVYQHPYVSAIELKGSKGQRTKAKKQLDSTAQFINDILGIHDFGLKIVYYTNGNYSFENIKAYKGLSYTRKK